MANFDNIIQEINTNLPDNTTQAITAAKLRTTLIDLTNTIDTVQDDFESNVNESIDGVDEAIDNINNDLAKKRIYTSTPKNYENDVAELYSTLIGDENITQNIYLKAYNRYVSFGLSNSTVIGNTNNASFANTKNGEAIPIITTVSNNENYPVGSILGYVVFNDKDNFLSKPSDNNNDIINKDFCSGLGNSPIISSYISFNGLSTEVDNLSTEVDNLSTEVDNLSTEVDNLKKVYTTSDFLGGYTSTDNKQIGDSISPVTGTTWDGTLAGQLVLSVKQGDIVNLKLKSATNQYLRTWIFTDTTYHILSWCTELTNNWIDNPLTLTASSDGYLFIQIPSRFYNDNVNVLKVSTMIHLEDLIPEVESITVCVPDEINAIVGDTLQLYYHSIFRCVDFRKYDVNITCTVGAQYPRYFEITPIASQIGNYPITFSIYDNNHNLLGSKSSTLKIKQKVSSPSSELNVLCVGASATENGEWASELKRRLTSTGGNPIGSEVSNVNFVGRKSVVYNGITVNLEATGGYSFNSYNSLTTARYRFNVSTFEGLLINVDDVYTNNGYNFTVKEIHSTDNYFSCDGTGTPESASTSNPKTLTKVSGTGSETISYTSTSFSGNPFVYNGVIDIQQYADDYCNPQQAEHGRIDVVYTELFGNGSSAYQDVLTERLSQMQTFINNISAVFPNCKFCISTSKCPDVKGGMGVNYGATGSWHDPYGMKYTFINLLNALQDYINDNNLGDKVYIINWVNEFDTENNYLQGSKALNPRYKNLLTEVSYISQMTTDGVLYLLNIPSGNYYPGVYVKTGSVITQLQGFSEDFGRNGVHPSVIGYYQMADTCWRLFISKFCQ